MLDDVIASAAYHFKTDNRSRGITITKMSFSYGLEIPEE